MYYIYMIYIININKYSIQIIYIYNMYKWLEVNYNTQK